MSPEVLLYNSPAKPSMDIWALGVILYRMIYGIYPFDGDSRRDIYEKIKKGVFSFPTNKIISYSCKSLITRMLQVEPKNRISTVDLSNDIWLNKSISELIEEET